MILELQKPYPFSDVIIFAFNEEPNELRDSFFEGVDIYVEGTDVYFSKDWQLTGDTLVYLDETVDDEDYDEENNPEGYSEFVLKNGLEFEYLGQNFCDVIDVYKDQRDELDIDLVLKSLDYYAKRDTFLAL